jgi:membrane-associated phospholipid phosphatase
MLFAPLIAWIDLPVAVYFHGVEGAWWVEMFGFVTEAGDSKWTLVPSLVVGAVFWWRRREIARPALAVFAAVAGSGLMVNAFKIMLCRYRPAAYFDRGFYGFDPFAFAVEYSRNSFPSGHATTAAGAAVALGLIFPRFRFVFWAAGALVAFSRVPITAHYLSDVLAGGLVGVWWGVWMHRLLCGKHGETDRVKPEYTQPA